MQPHILRLAHNQPVTKTNVVDGFVVSRKGIDTFAQCGAPKEEILGKFALRKIRPSQGLTNFSFQKISGKPENSPPVNLLSDLRKRH